MYDEVKALFKVGRTSTIKGFTSKAGKPFDAMVELDDQFKKEAYKRELIAIEIQ